MNGVTFSFIAVSVSFESNQYSFDEGSGEQSVRLVLNRNISMGFSITVVGGV